MVAGKSEALHQNFVYLIETNISGHFIKNIIYPFTFAR